jgi:hypothetical protein
VPASCDGNPSPVAGGLIDDADDDAAQGWEIEACNIAASGTGIGDQHAAPLASTNCVDGKLHAISSSIPIIYNEDLAATESRVMGRGDDRTNNRTDSHAAKASIAVSR